MRGLFDDSVGYTDRKRTFGQQQEVRINAIEQTQVTPTSSVVGLLVGNVGGSSLRMRRVSPMRPL
jgi:hypothetical protein